MPAAFVALTVGVAKAEFVTERDCPKLEGKKYYDIRPSIVEEGVTWTIGYPPESYKRENFTIGKLNVNHSSQESSGDVMCYYGDDYTKNFINISAKNHPNLKEDRVSHASGQTRSEKIAQEAARVNEKIHLKRSGADLPTGDSSSFSSRQ